MKTIVVTSGEAKRRNAPQMAGMKVKILEIVPGSPHLITYRVEWPCNGGWTTITRKKQRGFLDKMMSALLPPRWLL